MKYLKKISLTQWIVISMILGILVGYLMPAQVYLLGQPFKATDLQILSTIFIRMIKCIIVPIIFSTLVVGIAGHSKDLKAVGRLAVKSLIYFEIVTTLALIIGLTAVNLTRPGIGIVLKPDTSHASDFKANATLTVQGFVEHLVPKSFFEAAANNDVLQVVFFAIIFAIALTQVNPKAKEIIIDFCESLSEVMFKFTGIVMKFAPIGIGGAMAYTVAHSGLDVLKNLAALVGTLYGSLLVMIFFVFIPILFFAKISIKKFFNAVKEPALIAFTTTSSDAALPDAIERMVEFGVPRRIVSFVLPTGYSFNLDGSTLYLAIASVFVAQAAGVNLSIWQQISMMLTLMITSKGVAAVPRASLVVLSGVLVTFGLPLEGIAIILGVDSLMDMARTCTNLIGNCLASAVMAKWEGELA